MTRHYKTTAERVLRGKVSPETVERVLDEEQRALKEKANMNDFDTVQKNLKTIDELKADIERLQDENSKLLENVKKERGVSFKVGEKHYSIRCRKGNNFLVSSDVAFGSWLKKDKVAE